MCGISGFSGQFDFNNLDRSLQVIAHRGPDDKGIYQDQSRAIGLGHVRLSILDLSQSGHQPMTSFNDQVVIVFNGEIYNFKVLKKELENSGYHFKGHSDTEVLVNMYLEYGEEMLSRLNGIFAFAIWDIKKQHLFLARDAHGIKPLYYFSTSAGVGFCSEIKGLLQLDSDLAKQKNLDIDALNRYLTFLWCPGEGTPLKSIRKLLPGQSMTVVDGQIKTTKNWYQQPFKARKVNKTVDEFSRELSSTLEKAVSRQLVADVPVGAFLSGGLDSSAIVALAKKSVADIHCFTISMEGGQEKGFVDDLPYAKQVAEHLDVPLETVHISADQMANDVKEMIYQLDEPLADPACLNVRYISNLARKQGYKVLLSGAGGDDLFSGYRRHQAYVYDYLWQWLPGPSRNFLANYFSNRKVNTTFSRRLQKLFNGANLDGDQRLLNYFSWVKEGTLDSLYSDEVKQVLAKSNVMEPLQNFLDTIGPDIKGIERMLALEQRFFLPDHNLNYTDKMSMAEGLEVRVPFLDPELVQFAATVPGKFKQHGKTSKWIFKKSMEAYLPHNVVYRPKTGFGAPLRRWIKHELADFVADTLSRQSISNRGLFNPDAVIRLINENLKGNIDASYTIFSLITIEVWCRRFLDEN